MMLKSGNNNAVELDADTFKVLLNFYPEEKLLEYPTFKSALEKGTITITELKDASEKIHLPWQMFLLDIENLRKELKNIEDHRLDKFPKETLAIHKRKGLGNITSKRIIDRQIRIQSFVEEQLPDDFSCAFDGALKDMSVEDAIKHIIRYFQIDLTKFRTADTIELSKEYLIERIQSRGNINIAQGVRINGILPEIRNTLELFRNTSGFVIKDKKIPFIFLPSEINPDENHYRQIYTLLYLVAVIGAGTYSHAIENYSMRAIRDDKSFRKLNAIVSGILLPNSVTAALEQSSVDARLINRLKQEYRLSYSAILFILRTRKIIDADTQKHLELPRKEPSRIREEVTNFFSHPHIATSVKKFCGSVASEKINTAIRQGLYPNRAQLIIFGRFRKDKWLEFRARI